MSSVDVDKKFVSPDYAIWLVYLQSLWQDKHFDISYVYDLTNILKRRLVQTYVSLTMAEP